MLNSLKNIVYFFSISIIMNQLNCMQHLGILSSQRIRYNFDKTIPSLDNVTLVDFAIDKICQEIKLTCKDKTVFTKNPSNINTFINEKYFQNLPHELIEKIKSRFLAKYGSPKILFMKQCQFFDQRIILFKTSGKNIAMLSRNLNLCIYNFETDKKEYFENIKTFEFLPDGNLVVACENGLFVIDKDSYEKKLQIDVNLKQIKNIISVSKNKLIISLSDELLIWDLTNCKVDNFIQTKNAHKKAIISVTQLSDKIICTTSFDKTVKLWDLDTRTLLATVQPDIPFLTFKPLILPNGNLLLQDANSIISIFDICENRLVNNIETKQPETVYENLLKDILIISNTIIIASSGRSIKVWDINHEAGKCIRRFNPEFFNTHKDEVNSIILLGKNLLASCSQDCTLKLWDITTGKSLSSIEERKPLKKLINLENNRIAACDESGSVYFYKGPNFEDRINDIANKCINIL